MIHINTVFLFSDNSSIQFNQIFNKDLSEIIFEDNSNKIKILRSKIIIDIINAILKLIEKSNNSFDSIQINDSIISVNLKLNQIEIACSYSKSVFLNKNELNLISDSLKSIIDIIQSKK